MQTMHFSIVYTCPSNRLATVRRAMQSLNFPRKMHSLHMPFQQVGSCQSGYAINLQTLPFQAECIVCTCPPNRRAAVSRLMQTIHLPRKCMVCTCLANRWAAARRVMQTMHLLVEMLSLHMPFQQVGGGQIGYDNYFFAKKIHSCTCPFNRGAAVR